MQIMSPFIIGLISLFAKLTDNNKKMENTKYVYVARIIDSTGKEYYKISLISSPHKNIGTAVKARIEETCKEYRLCEIRYCLFNESHRDAIESIRGEYQVHNKPCIYDVPEEIITNNIFGSLEVFTIPHDPPCISCMGLNYLYYVRLTDIVTFADVYMIDTMMSTSTSKLESNIRKSIDTKYTDDYIVGYRVCDVLECGTILAAIKQYRIGDSNIYNCGPDIVSSIVMKECSPKTVCAACGDPCESEIFNHVWWCDKCICGMCIMCGEEGFSNNISTSPVCNLCERQWAETLHPEFICNTCNKVRRHDVSIYGCCESSKICRICSVGDTICSACDSLLGKYINYTGPMVYGKKITISVGAYTYYYSLGKTGKPYIRRLSHPKYSTSSIEKKDMYVHGAWNIGKCNHNSIYKLIKADILK